MDYRNESPEILKDFLSYHETIKNQSDKTISEYFLDMRTFFRYMKTARGLVPENTDFNELSILDIDLDFVRSITLSEIYDYLAFLSRDREVRQNSPGTDYGIGAAARARKISTLRSFYKYLTNKAHLMEENPASELEFPRLKKSLPKFLTLEESLELLSVVSGENSRDFCILTLFLNCGLRISELTGLNVSDVHRDRLLIRGKGAKERSVFLNEACKLALKRWLDERDDSLLEDKRPLFISKKKNRMSNSAVHRMVKKYLLEAGIDSTQFSAHKLRHTAATLMLRNGVDVRTLQELLGHDNLNTTQIYTHVDNTELRIAADANPLSGVKPKDGTD